MKGTKPLVRFIFSLLTALIVLTPPYTAAWGCSSSSADSQAPTVPKGLHFTNAAYTSASISWTASHDNIKVKGYQVYRDGRKITSTTKTTYTNTNLTPGRKYTYTVRAYDAAGNLSDTSSPISVITLSDVQNPLAPESLTASAATHTTITLSWDSSADNTSIKGYEVYCNGKKKAASASAHYVVKSLTPGTSYAFFVKAYDIAGNYSVQSNSITASTAVDASAPSVPYNLKVSHASETEVSLTWSPSTDNVKVKRYDIYLNGKIAGSTTKTTFCSKGLLPGSSYTYSIKAVDTSLNVSAISNTVKVSTLKDQQPPTAPAGLKLKSAKGSSVALEWTASTDNIKVKEYQIYCNGVVIESTTRTSRTVKSPFGTSINIFYIKAVDQSGNLSSPSKSITVLTAK